VQLSDDLWFERLVEAFGPRALGFAFMQVDDFAMAEDLVQQAFVKVWQSSRTPRSDLEFKRWLFRVIANLAKDYHRQARLDGEFPAEPAMEADPFERLMASDVVIRALRCLPMRDRRLLYLRYFEDETLGECARQLSMHPVTARVMVGRALAKLRRLLADPSFQEVAQSAT
jgi:RNA polymerase sigma factor (sigma-70 family)